jgi:hypothetical protein
MTGVAIMGLHRGGTSAVAGVIHALGFYMGDDLLPPSEHNTRGYFESYRMMKLHTTMMSGDIWNPDIDVAPYLIEYEDTLVSLKTHENWAVKDPRFCYLLPWLCGYYDKLVIVIRSTAHAAASLHARGGHTEREAVKISVAHSRKLFKASRNFPGDKHYIHYDTLMGNPEFEIKLLAHRLGVECNDAAVSFIDPTLRHWR